MLAFWLPSSFELLILALVWIGPSIAIAFLASRRGRSPFIWFVVSVIFSPVIGICALLATQHTVEED